MYDISTPYHDERDLPSFTLRQIDLPEILQWEVNGKYYLVMKVEMTSIQNHKDLRATEDQDKLSANFQVESVKALGDKPVDAKTIEKDDFNRVVSKAKSGGY